jgi:hypothetical protein
LKDLQISIWFDPGILLVLFQYLFQLNTLSYFAMIDWINKYEILKLCCSFRPDLI